jgi:hypothetical protein
LHWTLNEGISNPLTADWHGRKAKARREGPVNATAQDPLPSLTPPGRRNTGASSTRHEAAPSRGDLIRLVTYQPGDLLPKELTQFGHLLDPASDSGDSLPTDPEVDDDFRESRRGRYRGRHVKDLERKERARRVKHKGRKRRDKKRTVETSTSDLIIGAKHAVRRPKSAYSGVRVGEASHPGPPPKRRQA